MIVATESVLDYEAHVAHFKPQPDLAATNSNDVRRFIYDWFTHFEHAAPTAFYLDHLDDTNLELQFPGSEPITSHDGFARWYTNLLADTLWNFHDLSAIQTKQSASREYLATFLVNWYGEVRAESDQLAGWQSRSDSRLYHHFIRQTWTMTVGDLLVIKRLVAADGNTPSPIVE
jgi:hypothetical protein